MNNQPYVPYRFEISEQIQFVPGEEIEDLYSIQVDSEVDVFRESQFVQLRGVLIVKGDYQTKGNDQSTVLMDEENENIVRQTKALDNGFMEFQYPIPIDVSIPNYRLRADNELDVVVDYFDYELTEPKTLKIYAGVQVEGLQELDEQRQNEEPYYNADFGLQQFPNMNQQPTSYNIPEKEETEEDINPQNSESSEEEIEKKEPEVGRIKKEQSQSLQQFLNKNNKSIAETEEKELSEPLENEEEKAANNEQIESTDIEEEKYEEDLVDDQESENDAPPSKKGLGYLSKFFRDSNANQAKIKLRMVQADETIEQIAAACGVSVASVKKVNNLSEDTDIKEGELIYVPVEDN
ncbi:LysM peptidoglycan-binding domain-containing protein [Halalkalibacillus halophilus]|uniref:LysM peptidoglycan-binding domain-containing protein n=1 Tax=Halalkalibacillus halophilus TaxID=392827 RepID=UPI00040949E9|nr:LysM peptidoglycan-binding domain-containing protein [Halalkalibacillus halophilus]